MSLPSDVLFHLAMHPKMQTAPTASLGAILSADGAFRELGDRLDDAWRAEAHAAGPVAEHHRAEAQMIVRRILEAPARSADAGKVKGRAILWAHAHGRAAMVDALPDTPDLQAVKAALKGVLARA